MGPHRGCRKLEYGGQLRAIKVFVKVSTAFRKEDRLSSLVILHRVIEFFGYFKLLKSIVDRNVSLILEHFFFSWKLTKIDFSTGNPRKNLINLILFSSCVSFSS